LLQPFEDDQILAVYKLFHEVLLSRGCGVKSELTFVDGALFNSPDTLSRASPM
jgi:hypothetical protein